jgi:hypothetical protein
MELHFLHSRFIIYWRVKDLRKWRDDWDIHVGDCRTIWYYIKWDCSNISRCIITTNNFSKGSIEFALRALIAKVSSFGIRNVRLVDTGTRNLSSFINLEK